ncbi:hypothetical protein BH11MYX2_BH11MYX2_33490 [soil metagenome]
MSKWVALAVVVVLGGCGARQKQANDEQQDFACKDRYASYIATNHLGGSEIGVQMDCADQGPRIKRWRIEKAGNRLEDARAMTPGEFDDLWAKIDASGWAYLKDCENGTAGKHDPIFVFDVKDDQQTNSFQCQSQQMPFPYNTITDPLDVAAQKDNKQLGDPEPDDLKKLDKKDLQK